MSSGRTCPSRFRVLATALVTAVLLPASAASAQSSDPEQVPWTTLLPPATAGEPAQSSSPLCPGGQTKCVDVVIREMERRFAPLVKRCDHDIPFALTYLRTTLEYRRAVSDPNFFQDTAFVNHEDVVFADYYFRAYDAWHTGRGGVPPAWRVAFEAADKRQVSGTGNLLLGVSAHVNRDLPFALAELGITDRNGRSRKPDHDRVNDILVKVTDNVVAEGARRFDPTMDDTYQPGTTLDELTLFQLLASWREGAWRNAERLVAARTPEQRAQVAASIESQAETTARLLVVENAYVAPLSSSAERDTWCAQHGGKG